MRIADDHAGFVLSPSGARFTPWGFNYPAGDKLIEDYWITDWPRVEDNFRQMRSLGANAIRIHFQVGKIMSGPDVPNEVSLRQLGRLIDLAEHTHLYLDLTGLACYRKADVPGWYDLLDERGRWSTQQRFWEAVAAVTADRPGVFCLDLMNEPLSPGDKRPPGQWYSGKPFGGLDFLQFISLDPAKRTRSQVVKEWITAQIAAIRKHDRTHPITVGLLPWVAGWGYLSGFVPAEVASQLDFISVHIYPGAGKVGEAVEITRKFAVGKPVLVEETFPLSCPASDLKRYLRQSRPIAAGWLGNYEGQTLGDLRGARAAGRITPSQSLLLDWLELFQSMTPELTGESVPSSHPAGSN